MVNSTKWDVVSYLDSEESVAAYIEAAFEDGNPAVIYAAIGDIARARGLSEVSQLTGLSRESLYKSLSPTGKPRFETVMKVMDSLGFQLSAVPKSNAREAA